MLGYPEQVRFLTKCGERLVRPDDAATKLIYLAIRNFEKTGRCVLKWAAAGNQFAILWPEPFNK